jgi:uncharacterized protein (TIGR03437 family)
MAIEAKLNAPFGVATDYAGSVYIADLGNARIRKVTPDGRIITIAGHTPETKLIAPRNVAVDGPGNVVIADFAANRVYRLTAQGLVAIAGAGRAGFAGDGGPGSAALLDSPAGLAFDPAGNLYIGDTGNKKVRMLSTDGVITSVPDTRLLPIVATGLAYTYATGDLWVPDGNGGTLMRVAPQQQGLAFPFAAMDVAADFAGNVFAVQDNLIRRVDRKGTISIVGGGSSFYLAGDGADAVQSRMRKPSGLAWDPSSGSIFLADSGNGRIRRISTDTGTIETVTEGFKNPQGIAWDRLTNSLYIADAGTNSVWNWTPKECALVAGSSGKAGFAGDGGLAFDAQLSGPMGVAVDDRGNVWIADTGNDRVRVVSPSDKRIRTVARLIGPAGMAWDNRSGHIYAAEPSSGSVHRLYDNGATEPIRNPGIWMEPRGLTFDFDGNMLVADAASNRVTRLSANVVTALAGTGEAGFDTDSATASVTAKLDGPSAVIIDGGGRIVIADTGNDRVRVLEAGGSGVGQVVDPPPAARKVTLLNAASRVASETVAPGELVAVSGIPFAADSVLAFHGTPAQTMETTPTWLIQVPDVLTEGETELTIANPEGVILVRQAVRIAAAAPGIYAPLINAVDGSPNGPANPVLRGATLSIFLTGEGRSGLPVQVQIRDTPALVLTQEAVTDRSGVRRVDVAVPSGYFPAGSFPIRVRVGEADAQAGLTVAIR